MVTLLILINDLLDMFCILFAFSQTLLSCEGTDCLIMQEKVIIAKNATITHYTGQSIWHLEEETKNDNRNMTYRRQYCL